jgi:predicted heme/steroid binding protein
MKKYSLLMLIIPILYFLLQGLSTENINISQDINNEEKIMITIEELSKYNGKDNNPAYVAHDGIIYDVSNSRAWKKGTHKGNSAGQDVSKLIKRSPHGTRVLRKLPIVGELVITRNNE